MNPLVIIELITALIKFATVMAEGQTPEQKKIIWDWVIRDITWWREHLGIDTPKPKQ